VKTKQTKKATMRELKQVSGASEEKDEMKKK
jgi:hypothetical protein